MIDCTNLTLISDVNQGKTMFRLHERSLTFLKVQYLSDMTTLFESQNSQACHEPQAKGYWPSVQQYIQDTHLNIGKFPKFAFCDNV